MRPAGADAPASGSDADIHLRSDDGPARRPPPEQAAELAGRRSVAPAAARLRERLPSLGPRSLTIRLVSVVGVLMVVLIGASGAATYYSLRPYLVQRLQQQVASVANGNAAAINQCYREAPTRSCTLTPAGGGSPSLPLTEWVIVLSPSGHQIGNVRASRSLKPMELADGDVKRILSQPFGARSVVTTDGSSLLVTARPVAAPSGELYVVSGLATDDLRETLGKLVGLEVFIGLVAIVVALGLTTWGVQLSLRGLRRVTDTAQDVSTELSPEGAGLDRRVPNDEPHTEVGQLATSFNTMLSAVETQFAARVESEERMRRFLADASHELRTPLTSIRGYAELARMQRAAGEAGEDNLSRIESEGTRMSRLVEDLLTLARGDTAAPPSAPELIDLATVVDDAVSGARAAFPQREFVVRPAPPLPFVLGDRDQLLRVVRNLLTNAAVHTEPTSPITVASDLTAGTVRVQVIDGGPGLPPEQVEHVFERFWRADKARTRVRGGSGLGLSIVASIVRAHGGTVGFDSSVERGSVVTVSLPAAEVS